ncbi:hypothetical protein FHS18_004624 [Paenibacillus phyllosphaerae]|uniref:Uncharacterized protein n=1 Tax=Paenibacillus phyllosphaerae TaxID=274593 RepID=A0A7W5B1A9_9BACL|nr:hypothetical protein [Paenibacillus phyllosphaerae]
MHEVPGLLTTHKACPRKWTSSESQQESRIHARGPRSAGDAQSVSTKSGRQARVSRKAVSCTKPEGLLPTHKACPRKWTSSESQQGSCIVHEAPGLLHKAPKPRTKLARELCSVVDCTKQSTTEQKRATQENQLILVKLLDLVSTSFIGILIFVHNK